MVVSDSRHAIFFLGMPFRVTIEHAFFASRAIAVYGVTHIV